jgi:hypothetical protein
VLRIYGPKKGEVTQAWRKIHTEELHNLYSLPNIIRVITARRMRWAGHVAHMGETKKSIQNFSQKPKGNRPLWENRHES